MQVDDNVSIGVNLFYETRDNQRRKSPDNKVTKDITISAQLCLYILSLNTMVQDRLLCCQSETWDDVQFVRYR